MRPIADLDGFVLRANPGYEVVSEERLTATHRAGLERAAQLDDFYGYVRPRPGSGLTWQAIDMHTALLFFSLTEPGPVPRFMRDRLASKAGRVIARLVLDEIFEVRGAAGFLTGAAARDLVLPRIPGGGTTPDGPSLEALRYGQALAGMPAGELAFRLYAYGRKPITAAWRKQLPDAAAVERHLGLGDGPARSALDAGWVEALGDGRFWRMWRPRWRREPDAVTVCKLYVGVAPEAVREAIHALAGIRGSAGFKVGCDLAGLLRPDKLVAYFASLDALLSAARVLEDRLRGLPAHGVPFTAAIDTDGLLSWGADPQAGPRGRGPGLGSWRMWIADRLAASLVATEGTDLSATERIAAALERLRLDGVDTERWSPLDLAFGAGGEGRT